MDTPHVNSKTITVFRAGSFLSRSQGKDVEDHFAMSKASIGSYWEGGGSQKIASGLSSAEEELLLPSIIDITPQDKDFRREVTRYYAEINTEVPYGTGLTLEIGLETDNKGPVSKTNFPINLSDYIRYRQLKGHPHVAGSREEGESNPNKQFYILDKEALENKTQNKTKEKDAAFAIYLKIKEEEVQVDTMLIMMGVDPREFSGKNRMDEKQLALRNLAETKPGEFTALYATENLEIRAWVVQMEQLKVIKKMGTKYYDSETNKLIGNNMEETIYYFLDEENSADVALYKARTQEASALPVEKKKRVTKPLAGRQLT